MLARPSAASSGRSAWEIPGAEQAGGTLSPLRETAEFSHTKAARSWLRFLKVSSDVPHFSLAPAGRQPFRSFG